MGELKFIGEGKTKRLYLDETDGSIVVEYKDVITALNGFRSEVAPEKGSVNNQISSEIFKYLEERGINTHFLETIKGNQTRVKYLNMIPLEVVVRNKAAGSYLKKNELISEGESLKEAVVEFYFKDDNKGDPELKKEDITRGKILSDTELNELVEITLRINEYLKEFFGKIEIDLMDFKIEFGKIGGIIVLGDEISPDSCRLRDLNTGSILDKDIFRTGYGSFMDGYREVLKRIRKGNCNEKSID